VNKVYRFGPLVKLPKEIPKDEHVPIRNYTTTTNEKLLGAKTIADLK
jgi:hypothetical protein